MAKADLIPEGDITIHYLDQLCKQASIRTEPSDNSLRVIIDGIIVTVCLDAEVRALRFIQAFRLKTGIPLVNKFVLANRMNSLLPLYRFSVPIDRDEEARALMVDFHLSYEGGVTSFQIVNTLRNIAVLPMEAVQAFDKDGMVG